MGYEDGIRGLLQLEKKKKEETSKSPLTRSMIVMLIVGWLLPVTLIAMAILFLASSVLNRQIERTITTSTEKAVEICEMKLREIMTASKNASYSHTIRDSYYEYLESGDDQALYTQITYFLNQQYKYDESMLCTMVYMMRDPEQIYYTYNTYQENNEGLAGYSRVTFFQEKVQQRVIEMSAELDTNTMLVGGGEHIYMVRNLVDASFRPFAMIVIELHPENVFGSMDSVWGETDYQVYLDKEPLCVSGFPQDLDLQKLDQGKVVLRNVMLDGENATLSCKESEFGGQHMVYVTRINNGTLVKEFVMMRNTFLLVLVSLIPLLMMMYRFFYLKVTKPVRQLVLATEAISQGKFGHQITDYAGSAEFDYLQRNFNAMSEELKYQFETIYKEELALKDANIKALQSQINPHFLNNTLEIINWEARLCGADNVSGMIEALGTMLRATMNRKQRRFVTLAEELSYVDAYLYIISRRFGDRFKVSRSIDESLLQMEVPILIIQPIVENAVEHGVEENKEGMVQIRITSDWDKIIIDVINDGCLSEKDKERIAFLLEGEEMDDNEHHVSLGIRNVNRRIKIIYGEDCGLTITDDDQNNTISRIVVKMTHESNFPTT